jgi:protein involved in polysaccharide export with SLBB domain
MVWSFLGQGRRRCAAIGLALASAGFLTLPAVAQTPTAAQIEAFKALPASQQQELLREFGLDPSALGLPPATAPTAATTTATPLPADGTVPPTEPLPVEVELDEEPRLEAGSTLLLDVTESIALALEQLGQIDRAPPAPIGLPVPKPETVNRAFVEFQRSIRSGNPYRLDRLGRLVLPNQVLIPLAGLTVAEAQKRLNADPRMESMSFSVKLLPVEPEVRPFGYDIFATSTPTFLPATDIPVPSNYVIGPGDTLQLQLAGDTVGVYALLVGRDGQVNVPEIGPVAVAGLSFVAAKDKIETAVGDQLIGTRAYVSVGALRSIQVFVLGEAVRPGSYTVSGLSTITNALFASGGVREIGSLRRIQLKRDGLTVQNFDFYDMLVNGDSSRDARLLAGDVILIPPIGPTATALGEVRRPAIYELREGDTADDLIRLAGGLTPEADARRVRIERVDNRLERISVTLDVSGGSGGEARLQAGDVVEIDAIRDRLEGVVALMGHVHRAGRVQYRPGMRLTDLVGSLDELKPNADTHYVLVRRETGPTRNVSVVSADLAAAFAAPGSAADLTLQARDTAHVFDLASSRERVVQPILTELERQSSALTPQQIVTVSGRVKVPGSYPLEPGMTVSDLIRAGGGFDQAAFTGEAELTRYTVVGGQRREGQLVSVDLGSVVAGDAAADLPLQAFDQIVVKEMPEWSDQESISILGEVRFPGIYPVRRGETLREVIRRAGGLTDLAFSRGAVYTREDLREREKRQLQLLAERLQRDLASLSLQAAQSGESDAAEAMSVGQSLLRDLQTTQAVGRLVINLDDVMAAQPGAPVDLIVRAGDALYVPRLAQEVMVLGEVQNATSHLYRGDLTRDDYIRLSGGVTQRADTSRTFVVRADGSVAAGESGGWFSRGAPRNVEQGDTIVVPIDAERMKPLTMWTAITTIMYNIALSVAAVNSF